MCQKAEQLSDFSELSSEQSRINLQRHEAHNKFERNDTERHKKRKVMRNGLSFLWPSTQMTQLCTQAVIRRRIVTIPDTDGGIFKTTSFGLLIILSLATPSYPICVSFFSQFISLLYYRLRISPEARLVDEL